MDYHNSLEMNCGIVTKIPEAQEQKKELNRILPQKRKVEVIRFQVSTMAC